MGHAGNYQRAGPAQPAGWFKRKKNAAGGRGLRRDVGSGEGIDGSPVVFLVGTLAAERVRRGGSGEGEAGKRTGR